MAASGNKFMNWREQVAQLEHEGNFDITIFLLEEVIQEYPEEMDAYIILLHRFMDSILENPCYWSNTSKDPLRKIKEEYCEDKIKHDYRERAQHCFDESYARFSDNPEYLYYASRLLLHAYDFMCLNVKESLLISMYEKAKASGYNSLIEQGYPKKEHDVEWAKRILNNPSIQEQLATKGAAAKYVIGETVAAAKRILDVHK
jgi:hypothetical protein